jgi:hypothetical protein
LTVPPFYLVDFIRYNLEDFAVPDASGSVLVEITNQGSKDWLK